GELFDELDHVAVGVERLQGSASVGEGDGQRAVTAPFDQCEAEGLLVARLDDDVQLGEQRVEILAEAQELDLPVQLERFGKRAKLRLEGPAADHQQANARSIGQRNGP